MTEFISWVVLVVLALLCAFLAIWLIYRVATKAQRAGSLTRRQEAWLAIMLLGVACTEALNSPALVGLLPAKALAVVGLVALIGGIATFFIACVFIDALIPGIWWLLLPWWAPIWLRPRSRHDANPRQ